LGWEAGATATNLQGCTLLGPQTSATNGINNSVAIGASAFVNTSNSISLGVGSAGVSSFVGIGNPSPAYALDIGTFNSLPPEIKLQNDATTPAAPVSGTIIRTVSNALRVESGSLSRTGIVVTANNTGAAQTCGRATLASGNVTVASTAVTANSIIVATKHFPSSDNDGVLRISAIVPGVSFTLTSHKGGDTSTVSWIMVNP